MKASLLVLSLALSATALFAQNSPAPAAPYSSIPAVAETAQIPDETLQLNWKIDENGFPALEDTHGRNETKISLKKRQNLIISVQNPNTSQIMPQIDKTYDSDSIGRFSIDATDYDVNIIKKYYINMHITKPSYVVCEQVCPGGESYEIQKSDIDPILYNFCALNDGRRFITIVVDVKGISYDKISALYGPEVTTPIRYSVPLRYFFYITVDIVK